MSLSAEDARAIAAGARQLGVDPRVLGGLMELESNVDPNIIGGAGKKYRGLIQFGPEARREVGLPDGPMSIAQQMPYVNEYFRQRGFKPGVHGPTELYRTVLVGNPGQSGTDSFGTNSDKAAKRMMPGGDLYNRFAARFDPVIGASGGSAALSPSAASAATSDEGNPLASLMKGLAGDALNPGSFGALSAPAAGRAQRQPGGAPASNNVRRLQLKNEIIGGLLGRPPGGAGIAPIGGAVDRLAGDALAGVLSPTRRSGSVATGRGSGGDTEIGDSVNDLITGIFAPKGAVAQKPATGGGGNWGQGPAVAVSHAETSSGYTIPDARDANGRPAVFSRSAANAFAAMVRDSGGLVKPSDIASSQRSESKNAAVGGAAGSQHLGGNAMDIHGGSHSWIEKNGARYGWHLNRYGGHGDHGGHFEFRG